MTKLIRTELVPLEVRYEEQSLESIEVSQPGQPNSELDIEIECPKCSGTMELHSNFDRLLYSCEDCSFQLKCV
jgi:hypothetical protein